MVIVPDCCVRKDAAKPAMVDLPEPDVPTNAITDPAGAEKLTFFNTSLPSS